MRLSASRAFLLSGTLAWAGLVLVGCASRPPEVKAEPETKITVPPEPRIALRPYHLSMKEEMARSFEKADEILIGNYTGTYADGPAGRSYYFDSYRVFDRGSWVWSPEMSALLPVLFQDVKPEIIDNQEFKSLSGLDRTGICWDDYEGARVIFLVEGLPNLVFLRQVYNEAEAASRRILIDAYPVSKECRAKDIFDLMLIERARR